jgi:hypothetical protein
MSRVQKEVQRTSTEPVFVCDAGCGKEEPALLPPAGWLVLRVARDEVTSSDPPGPYDKDFCSLRCLAAWLRNA